MPASHKDTRAGLGAEEKTAAMTWAGDGLAIIRGRIEILAETESRVGPVAGTRIRIGPITGTLMYVNERFAC